MTDHVVRVLRSVTVAIFIIGSLPLASSQAADQEAAPAAGTAPTPAEGAGAKEGAGTKSGSTKTSAARGATRSECEARVTRLVGKDPGALRDPGVRALVQAMPNVAVCAAVARDSDEPCDLLPDEQAKACRKTRSTYGGLRDPKGRAYIFPDAEYNECKTSKEYAAVCDPLRDAIRSGDVAKCPSTEPFASVCKASITLNPALCPADDADCKKEIERWKTYAGGLQTLKKSGSPEQRILAAAALGETDACKQMAKPAIDSCASGAAPTSGTEADGSPAGGATAATTTASTTSTVASP